jgi:Fur family ferric uptake transcriptional regulator
MSCETETAGVLRGAGQKVTPQRMLILAALRHHHTHATASEILEEVRHSYPFLDVSTVYRTLSSARELRLVSELTRSGADAEYEWIGNDPHHHLICRVCGGESALDSSYVETLAASLLTTEGFQADLDHFAIVGVCQRCAAAAVADGTGR